MKNLFLSRGSKAVHLGNTQHTHMCVPSHAFIACIVVYLTEDLLPENALQDLDPPKVGVCASLSWEEKAFPNNMQVITLKVSHMQIPYKYCFLFPHVHFVAKRIMNWIVGSTAYTPGL